MTDPSDRCSSSPPPRRAARSTARRAWPAAGVVALAVGVVAGCALPSTTGALSTPSPSTALTTTVAPTTTPPPETTTTAPPTTTPPTTSAHTSTHSEAAPATDAPRTTEAPVETTTTHAASLCGAPANPYGYNFCGGGLVSSPPSDICSYFGCIDNFWNGKGYMVECADGMYSMSGGRSGACSYHGGERRPVYS